ncbi:AP2/ERF and B3 domain-containing transcription factor At1g50680-like [Durio zibethinus]|uniref:AP2/ERF and B3 domain-containing transcription factor At1g50680-like n=1 Tax=Durio zibethinus TaxID=66656 RepID=A0A6P5XUC9_DURZI|nr:AP2/ERF and B3 domain-containing transcription factor At1g50680-like [Durio zibethinus]
MEDDESIMVLNAKLNVAAAETSDSGNSNYTLRANKRSRHENGASLARFKGVVPQQNGNWGAQIYANHQRIWLGTFKSEKEAAMAYDSAAVKLRNGDSHRNFSWTDHNIQEPNFQNLYSAEDVLNMIRDGSYQAKFADFVKTLSERDGKLGTKHNKNLVHGDIQFTCVQLFQKELTPSDVGKLNRLVIPKKYAAKYFPYICENDQQSLVGGGGGGGLEDIELVFYDKLMRTWKFRYCYWRSSQSFVFTRGWNRFVKEKKLRERDTIIFYTCEWPGGEKRGQNFFLIDVNYNGEQNCMNEEKKASNRLESSGHQDNLQVELELNLGKNFYCRVDNEDKPINGLESSHNVEGKRISLFGVHIN